VGRPPSSGTKSKGARSVQVAVAGNSWTGEPRGLTHGPHGRSAGLNPTKRPIEPNEFEFKILNQFKLYLLPGSKNSK
jgi:hypothetical protein